MPCDPGDALAGLVEALYLGLLRCGELGAVKTIATAPDDCGGGGAMHAHGASDLAIGFTALIAVEYFLTLVWIEPGVFGAAWGGCRRKWWLGELTIGAKRIPKGDELRQFVRIKGGEDHSQAKPANNPPYRSVKCACTAELVVRSSWFWLVGCPGRCRWVRPENCQICCGFSPIKMAAKRACRVRAWKAKHSSQIQRGWA